MQTESIPKIKTLCIDGKNLCMRSWHAFSPSKLSADGLGTSLIHGSFGELFRHVLKYRPEQTIITWDHKSRFRRELYPLYKNRTQRLKPEQYSDIDRQLSVFREGVSNLGICQVEHVDVEGDDLIALAVLNTERRPALIVSSDRDFYQLVRAGVWIYDPRKKLQLGLTSFASETGFATPGHYLAWKVLRGDPGDGVPSAMDRVGDKKAVALSMDLILPPANEVVQAAGLSKISFNDDQEVEEKLARNFKLVSLHAAVMIQRHLLSRIDFTSRKPDYDGFLAFCAKYKLVQVAKAYGEVCGII